MTSHALLTTYLLSNAPHALTRATTHPFLRAAGRGKLPKATLSQWLSQDRLYAQAYIRFIGLLLSKIRIPPNSPNSATSRNATPEEHATEMLIDALINIRTELQFFEETAAEYGLDLTAISAESGAGLAGSGSGSITTSAQISTSGSGSCPGFTGGCEGKSTETGERESEVHGRCGSQAECEGLQEREAREQSQVNPESHGDCDPACRSSGSVSAEPLERGGTVSFTATHTTRAYVDLFMSAGSAGVSTLEGLVVLWATEVCYLRSWKYAASFLDGKNGKGEDGEEAKKNSAAGGVADADGGALRKKFIPNWSSPDFEAFVNRIGDIVDETANQIKGVEEAEKMRGHCLDWWRQVVWLEERFWPDVQD
ncbi:hypothetical protein N7474_004060 [Penicillium riverlandense]|uniref:uncharacterized protein n=1 Tax=Penicillium riverlandense TaxID=1903569 RepID=UPI002547192C|nr:uncharacterized protein N7474_004060 [Penicillium riverlandense]KAJ5818469.1 hypothetical protein N7474_004060 [Penicillium riverlandense]